MVRTELWHGTTLALIYVIEEAEDHSQGWIFGQNCLFIHPRRTSEATLCPYLYTVRGVQTARAWNSKLKFASKNSAHLVYISPQHTAHYRHNSGLVPLKIAQLKGKQNPKRLNSWRKKKQEAYPQTYKAKSPRCRVQGGQYFRSHRRPKKLHLTQELTESL